MTAIKETDFVLGRILTEICRESQSFFIFKAEIGMLLAGLQKELRMKYLLAMLNGIFALSRQFALADRRNVEARRNVFHICLIAYVFLTLVSTIPALSQSGGNFAIEGSVIASGGGRTNGGVFEINSTIGQPLTGESSGVPFTLIAGFWGGRSSASLVRAPYDFDGDRKTDVSIFRPSLGEWWYLRSSNQSNGAVQFGSSSDKPAPGDFSGDGKTDIVFYRPANGFWFVLRSEDFSFFSFPFGTNGDIPCPADFDGDGKSDPCVYRPSSATWFISRSGDNGTTIANFGTAEDKPVAADYDGDGRADIAIFRPSAGEWWVSRSTAGLAVVQFGSGTDRTVVGDYTGDGLADIAFFRPSNGFWFVLRSENFSFFSFPFGTLGDLPAPGDYDGDGKIDAAVFRPSVGTWFLNRSTSGVAIVQFGAPTDLPVPGAFVRP